MPSKYGFDQPGAHVPEDKVQYIVQTPYGRALTVRTRPGMRELDLLDWQTNGRVPVKLFAPTDFASVSPTVGDDVETLFGRGRVISLRSDEQQQLQVLLSSWRLAGRSRVTCFLRTTDCRVVRSHRVYEMSVYERVEYALQKKQEASVQFQQKDYATALQKYAQAIDAIRYVHHQPDSSNEVRADLLLVMITCSNNAALCARQLGDWEQVHKFAKNAWVLIQALEEKKGKKIHQVLLQEHYTDAKLFGEFGTKSLLLQAKAWMEQGDPHQALTLLQQAKTLATNYALSDREILKLQHACVAQRKAVLQKEKQRARAMFQEEKKETAVEESSTTPDGGNDDSSPVAESTTTTSIPESSARTATTTTTTAIEETPLEKPPKSPKRVTFADPVDNDDVWDSEVWTGLGLMGACAVLSAWATYAWLYRPR